MFSVDDDTTASGRPFCGREEQLARLLSAWLEVKRGDGPQAVAILGESGFGKTRLVQEFYAELVRSEQDGAGGYWPPVLARDGNNLQINPPEASWDAAATLPFLWWGVRLTNLQDHNQVAAGALAGHVGPYLVPHLEPVNRELRRRHRLREVAKLGGAVAADLAGDLVPALGLIKRFGEIGLELKGIHDAWRQDRQVLSATEQAAAKRASLVEEVLADLGKLFAAPKGVRVPAVIVVDDAHFSPQDPGMVELVAGLLKRAEQGSWPLLLLVTHWQREWALQLEPGAEASIAQALVVAATAPAQDAERPMVIGSLLLGPVPDLRPVLASRLPGIDDRQAAALLARAGGNPRFLDELLRLVDLGGRGMFVGRDTSGRLTEDALTELLAAGTALQQLVTTRLAHSPDDVQQAVVLAALQGDEFLPDLVADVAPALGEEAAPVATGLKEASRTHAFVALDATGVGEFVQPLYREVAAKRLGFWFDSAEASQVLTDAVRRRMNSEHDPSEPRRLTALYRLAARVLADADDPADRRTAAHALHWLSAWAERSGDVHGLQVTAARLANLLGTLPDELLINDLDWLNITAAKLSQFGATAARRRLLERAVSLAESRSASEGPPSARDFAHRALAEAALAAFEDEQGAVGEGAARWQRAAASLERLQADQAQDSFVLEVAQQVTAALAAKLAGAGRLSEAERAYRECLSLLAHLKAADPRAADHYTALTVTCLFGLADCAMFTGDEPNAVALLREAEGLARDLQARAPSVAHARTLAHALHRLTTIATLAGDDLGTRPADLLRESLALARSNLAALPGVSWALQDVATLLEALPAHVANQPGGLDEAFGLVMEALALWREVEALEPPGAVRSNLAKCLLRVADVAYARGDLAVAKEHVTLSLELSREDAVRVGPGAAALALMSAIPQAALIAAAVGDEGSALALLAEAEDAYPTAAAFSQSLADRLAGRVASVRATISQVQDGD